MESIEKTTRALNLWDLKQREKELEMELDAVHQAMQELIDGEKSVEHSQITPYCE